MALTLGARTRRTSAALAPAICLSLLAGSAAAAPVGTGSLDWTMANVYDTATPAPNDRTWLGFVTSPNPVLGDGTASAGDGASGPTVSPSSPRGRDVLDTFSYPVESGTYDPASGRGTVQLRGTVTFDTTGSVGGNFKVTVADPIVVLNGSQALTLPPAVDPPPPAPPAIQPPPAQGQVFASGIDAAGQPYDTSEPILNLDLTAATITDTPDGTRTIAGIVPAGATGQPFPFAVNDGPRRDPDLYGSLTLRIGPPAAAADSLISSSADSSDPATTTPAGSALLPAALTGLSVRLGTTRAVRAVVTCPRAQALCATSLRVTHGGRRIGSRQALIGGGLSRTLTVRLSRTAAGRIARSSNRRVRLTLVTRDGTGTASVSRAVTAQP